MQNNLKLKVIKTRIHLFSNFKISSTVSKFKIEGFKESINSKQLPISNSSTSDSLKVLAKCYLKCKK